MKWACACGAFTMEVDIAKGTRAVCYCASCRDFNAQLGKPETLSAEGGVDLYQVAPERMWITQGQDKLAVTQFTAKGPLRWYTTCCNTPVANTLATKAWPFATLQSAWFAAPDQLGPVAARVNRKGALSRVPDDAGGVGRLMREFMLRALKSRLSGGWKQNPFFATDGAPVAQIAPIRR